VSNINPIEAINRINRQICYILNWIKKKPIEVIVGTPEATQAGVIEGASTIQSISFIGRYVEIFRNDINVHGFDYMDGNTYFLKQEGSDTIWLSTALVIGESIKIKIL